MRKCKTCGRTYDDSWRICLFCMDPLAPIDAAEEHDGTSGDTGMGAGLGVLLFTLILMLLGPVFIIIVILGYYNSMDIESIRHQEKQMSQAVVFEKEEEARK